MIQPNIQQRTRVHLPFSEDKLYKVNSDSTYNGGCTGYTHRCAALNKHNKLRFGRHFVIGVTKS